MAVVKFCGERLEPLVVYGVADNPDTAAQRAVDALEKKERWRADKLETRA